MKKVLSLVLAMAMVLTLLSGCGGNTKPSQDPAASTEAPAAQSEIDKIIAEAQTMSLEDLAKKAIAESNGKTFYGVGNSSRSTGTFAMTLIQDGNQIESKMVKTGILKTFIPKDWADANKTTAEAYKGYLPLQTLNKIFEYNNTGSKTYTNCWDFVAEGEHGLFMDIDSEIVGKNFLYMLTKPEYAKTLKEAYDALDASKKGYVDTAIAAVEKDAKDLGLDENGKYALAWIKLWVESYNAQPDDGPICNTLVSKSATDQFGLLVYSKLRSVEESDQVSKKNVTVAAYQDGYTGFGGYGYCHYLFVTKNSPLPWTACAFIAYMTCTVDGFSAWGKDIGGYSSNPTVAKGTEEKFNHSTSGGTDFPVLNDKGFDWWKNNGKLVLNNLFGH